MSGLAEIAQKAIALVTQAREEARSELSEQELDELDFSEDLQAEFHEDPSEFMGKYGDYLEGLSPDE